MPMRERKYRIVRASCTSYRVEYKDSLVWWPVTTAVYDSVYTVDFGSKDKAKAWIDNDIEERRQAAENRRRRDECIDEEPEYYP